MITAINKCKVDAPKPIRKRKIKFHFRLFVILFEIHQNQLVRKKMDSGYKLASVNGKRAIQNFDLFLFFTLAQPHCAHPKVIRRSNRAAGLPFIRTQQNVLSTQ